MHPRKILIRTGSPPVLPRNKTNRSNPVSRYTQDNTIYYEVSSVAISPGRYSFFPAAPVDSSRFEKCRDSRMLHKLPRNFHHRCPFRVVLRQGCNTRRDNDSENYAATYGAFVNLLVVLCYGFNTRRDTLESIARVLTGRFVNSQHFKSGVHQRSHGKKNTYTPVGEVATLLARLDRG